MRSSRVICEARLQHTQGVSLTGVCVGVGVPVCVGDEPTEMVEVCEYVAEAVAVVVTVAVGVCVAVDVGVTDGDGAYGADTTPRST